VSRFELSIRYSRQLRLATESTTSFTNRKYNMLWNSDIQFLRYANCETDRQTDRQTDIQTLSHSNNSQPSQGQTSYKILSWNDIDDEKNNTIYAYLYKASLAVNARSLFSRSLSDNQSYQMKRRSMIINCKTRIAYFIWCFIFQYNFWVLSINSKNNILS